MGKVLEQETIMHMMTSLWDAEFSALIDHYPYHGHNKFILSWFMKVLLSSSYRTEINVLSREPYRV